MRKAFSIGSAWMLAALLVIGGYAWAADMGTSSGTSKDSAKAKSTKGSSSDMGSSDMSKSASRSGGSENVKKAQMALKDKGQDPGPIDGVMGPKTRAAIKSYQSANNMKPTGQLDSATAKSLGVESASSSSSSSEKSSSKSAAKSGSSDTGGSSSSKTSKSSSSDTSSDSSSGSSFGGMPSGRNPASSRDKAK